MIERRFIQNIEHLLGKCELHKVYYLSLQKIMFWTKKANTFNKYKYPKEAIPMKKGKGSAVNELL